MAKTEVAPKLDKSRWPKAKGWTWWPLGKVVPYPRNARTHPPAQVTMLARLIGTHGPDQPIVVDEKGMILKGHGRRLGALEAGLDSFPVVQRHGLSEAEKAAMRIEDNTAGLLSGWDTELIRGEVTMLKNVGYDLNLLGFGEQQLVQFTTTPQPPGQFPTVGEDLPTEFCCPACRYQWSGKPKPDPLPPEKPKRKKEQ